MARKSSGLILSEIRKLMKNTHYVTEPLHAYVVPHADAHQNEYLAESDKRLQFLTNFTGSAGIAVITEHHACLWTDGRYFLQANKQMDDNWTLMKEGVNGTLTKAEWLGKTLPFGARVGVDPKIISYNDWRILQSEMDPYGQVLIPAWTNLIDIVWTDRPSPTQNILIPLPMNYTGVGAGEKIRRIREKMSENGATVLLVTALDEIAWTLNLRGSDIPYNPVFFSYLVIMENEVHLFVDDVKVTPAINSQLEEEEVNVIRHPYEDAQSFLRNLFSEESASDQRVWMSHDSSYAFTSVVPTKQLITSSSPIAVMKAIKNKVETNGLIEAHIRDAAALCCYFAWLQKEVPKGNVTEISGAQQLEKFRSEQEGYVGLSFETISGSGPNGAVIHYTPSLETNRVISTEELYLCDSGGQYKDGTTDVTRTMHFGTPTDFQKECFTRVLKGMINIATAIFPKGVKGNVLDTLARKYLWDVGLNYLHGTGHGIGAYLNVHEGPMGISWRPYPDDPGFTEGMFLSDEPGYYQDGEFGIRIENIVRVVEADPRYRMKDVTFLTFDTVTLVPIQNKMLIPEMLSPEEIAFLDKYHSLCREKVGSLLKQQNKMEALEWLLKETEPIG